MLQLTQINEIQHLLHEWVVRKEAYRPLNTSVETVLCYSESYKKLEKVAIANALQLEATRRRNRRSRL